MHLRNDLSHLTHPKGSIFIQLCSSVKLNILSSQSKHRRCPSNLDNNFNCSSVQMVHYDIFDTVSFIHRMLRCCSWKRISDMTTRGTLFSKPRIVLHNSLIHIGDGIGECECSIFNIQVFILLYVPHCLSGIGNKRQSHIVIISVEKWMYQSIANREKNICDIALSLEHKLISEFQIWYVFRTPIFSRFKIEIVNDMSNWNIFRYIFPNFLC